MTTQPKCCVKLAFQLGNERGNLRRLATRAVTAERRGRPTEKLIAAIADSKKHIEDIQATIVNHEAEHAA